MQKLAALLLTLLIAGCAFPGVYKINVQQGSIIKQEDLDQLSAGMTRRQVHSILGSPSVINPVDESQDHYMYTFQRAGQEIKQQQITIYYDGDTFSHYDAELLPLTPAY
ncbi:outer membrane protein assembly factor BamE [Marinobacter zhejiangensis]|uniref:Outer membrane protein assembly factor BamE n=1 Tax=Marinobacter zhejiangensis TaxID=488535 RepID=A0A1I4KVW0_9GAMM|nr:outer membrane protein assembly factor BamE [Marinobacter zhejiangensis]SFL82756.1 Beta-barrel assembly machine subunit BamE [Marinobacter zhejiangensis]